MNRTPRTCEEWRGRLVRVECNLGDVAVSDRVLAGARKRALIISGAGRYADPWHPFAETSARLGDVLIENGFDVDINEDVDAALAALNDDIDLLIVNVGDPALRNAGSESDAETPDAETPDAETRAAEIRAAAAGRTGFLAYIARGGPVLAMHASASSFSEIPEWEEILGGRWVRGTSWHPKIGMARVTTYPRRHSIAATSEDFELYDELYSDLRVAADVITFADHDRDGTRQPLMWARSRGRARVVYDALGHDTRSFDAQEHRKILGRAARWLVGDSAVGPEEARHR